jgi:superfamily II DNA or RNA helicase
MSGEDSMQMLFDLFSEPKLTVEKVIPASTVTLRPYQREAVDSVFQQWEEGVNSTLVCLPTGCGKSVVFSEVMRRICTEGH